MQAAAPSLQIQLHILDVRVAQDLEGAFKEAAKARAGALAVTAGLFNSKEKQIVETLHKVKNALVELEKGLEKK